MYKRKKTVLCKKQKEPKFYKPLDKRPLFYYNRFITKRTKVFSLKAFHKGHFANALPCLYDGVLCGSMVGAFIFLFKYVAKKVELYSVFSIFGSSPISVIAVFAILIASGLIMSYLHRVAPEIRGGGIPRSEGVLRGVLSFRWIRTLFGTFFGSVLSFFCGLPLGSEGPAVLMGTSIGAFCGKGAKNPTARSRYVMTGGAGAGFAVATGAPLSGILFALEEIHKRFTPMLVLTVSSSVVSATLVNRLLCDCFGIDPNLFRFDSLGEFELSHIGYLTLLGIMVALAVALFDGSIELVGRFMKSHSKITPAIKLCSVFILTGILGYVFREGIFSGHHLIQDVAVGQKGFLFLIIVFAVRLIMMLMMTGSGATGGIFIPTLAIGASFSAIAGKVLLLIGLPEELYTAVVLLGMCAFIGGTLRAPLTASLLFLELTLQFTNLLFVALVVFIVSLITEMFGLTPFYDTALEGMVETQNHGKTARIARFEITVSEGAFVVGKTVRDILWPASSAVIAVRRADESVDDMDNDGEKRLFVGDKVRIRVRFFDENEVRALLSGLVGSDHEITILD